jgi:hypothetical protein
MMFSTYSEELDQIRQYAQEEVQRWADRFVGHEVKIFRETKSLLAKGKVKQTEAVGVNVKFSFEDGMWCTMPSGCGYTITK